MTVKTILLAVQRYIHDAENRFFLRRHFSSNAHLRCNNITQYISHSNIISPDVLAFSSAMQPK